MFRRLLVLIFVITIFVTVLSSCKEETTEPEVNPNQCAIPVISPGTGCVPSGQSISITCMTSGASIRYTIDGSVPMTNSAVYSEPLNITASTAIKAQAFKSGWDDSPVATSVYTIGTTRLAFVPAGAYTMGGTHAEELPLHTVILNSFYLGKYEVTQGEYQAIMGNNPSTDYGVGSDYPVYNVSWYSALKYCNLRSMAEGLTPVYTISGSTNPANWGAVPYIVNSTWDAVICKWTANGYRLPTEAEWEYAARGGSNVPNYFFSGSDEINDVAWHSSNSSSMSHIVGTKAANTLGIYDMSGNILEWCWDWYDDWYYSSSPTSNPTGPSSGSCRVMRGGSWFWIGYLSNVGYRHYEIGPNNYHNDLGFRICRSYL